MKLEINTKYLAVILERKKYLLISRVFFSMRYFLQFLRISIKNSSIDNRSNFSCVNCISLEEIYIFIHIIIYLFLHLLSRNKYKMFGCCTKENEISSYLTCLFSLCWYFSQFLKISIKNFQFIIFQTSFV